MLPENLHLNIGSLLFEDLDQIDLTGPFAVLSRIPNATHRIYATSSDPVSDHQGLRIAPDAKLAEARNGWDGLKLPNAVRPGDGLELETTVLEMRESKSKSDRGIVRARVFLRNQRHEAVLECIGNIFVARRPVTAEELGLEGHRQLVLANSHLRSSRH